MIPIRLTISGFLSYKNPAELDFTLFDLACIAGPNGAGKSSLLDAFTWVLFGKARKIDDSIINSHSKAAEVSLVFFYEGNFYRVQRSKPRDKTAVLEFQILQPAAGADTDPAAGLPPGTWKALTEHGLRETDARIQQTLRMDYETFVNASFFLQGRADQFTQQSRGDRKRILGSILGLEVWEGYRQRAFALRRQIEDEITAIDGQLREIGLELSEENTRTARLKQLETDLQRLSQERQTQEAFLVNLRKLADSLAEQKKWLEALARRLDSSRVQYEQQAARLAGRIHERDQFAGLLARKAEIETAYQDRQAILASLEQLDQVAARFREHEGRRAEPRAAIQAEEARLRQEQAMLQDQRLEIEKLKEDRSLLQAALDAAREREAGLKEKVQGKDETSLLLQTLRDRYQELGLQTTELGRQAAGLRQRSEQLVQAELGETAPGGKKGVSAVCPLCGQPLGPAERQALVDSLNRQADELDELQAASRLSRDQVQIEGAAVKRSLEELVGVEGELNSAQQEIGRLESRLETITARLQAWEAGGGQRMAEVEAALVRDDFALEARRHLAAIDDELRQIGYDPQSHDDTRRAEQQSRPVEDEMRLLEKAQAAHEPLAREVGEMQQHLAALAGEIEVQQAEHDQAAAALAAALAQAPDLPGNEQALLGLQERENALRREVGAAQQLVAVLESLKKRRKALESERAAQARQSGLYSQLERAFSKDGVPALLIEQALPQIEAKANEILERLTGGSMAVSFATQAEYKDKRRDDRKETLDILIRDGAGERDYELFSGGEAFRVNFAIRLALSEVLAQRAGARLQMLVIDEGFGSQDAEGRQRLIESINLVRKDFAKILVITHIDELKDRFPTRIEVEKTASGSTLQVIN